MASLPWLSLLVFFPLVAAVLVPRDIKALRDQLQQRADSIRAGDVPVG